jgi:hypothetical protein
MRWRDERKVGDKRLETWFAWFPVRINDETRWLETVRVLQRRNYMQGQYVCQFFWENINFADEECRADKGKKNQK